ncbi:cell division protein ZapA [Algirhabdus cladophorae]|uniref:cell division protein ZapA n=1 Tax=Algirhabdus cladophorae TaxID=3377108 RepID=UPI003B84B38D
MAEVDITIGARVFTVSCQEGEEHFLHAAAKYLDTEAQILVDQIGRLPENRMLLMAGLMLADKTAGLDEKVRIAAETVGKLEARIEELENRPSPQAERVEVAVVPDSVTDALAELAARAEALAETVEAKVPEAG